ncbi:hypothetical protein G7Z17_g9944 [Cylindrodendrum hubeiense]|uniref:Uncharacterized protein n=1 Tax=Cylindrodendrum hubeiense TaxID=595255 RepID=A0A9P5GYJ7_9HYPO|nr:hypothetical protein G7Z17_g9944 [Cylindrodendrum hubeiense]
MLRFAPWAMLATAPLAQARFDWLNARHQADECLPCPAPGAPDEIKTVTISEPAGSVHTVTVTEPAGHPSKETITIEHTITQPGKTIYITHTQQHTVTKKVTIPAAPYQTHNEYHDKTATIEYALPSQSAVEPKDDDDEILIKTITIGGDKERVRHSTITVGDEEERVKTVTLQNMKESDKIIHTIKTVTIGHSNERIITKTIKEGDKYHTVTIGNSDDRIITKTIKEGDKYHTITIGNSDEGVVTKTIKEGDKYRTVTIGDTDERVVTKTIYESGKPYTVVVKPEPSCKTITLEGGKEITETIEVYRTATITAPAQTQTITKQEYKTITATVTDSHGQPDIEIIIINIETGKSTCKKKLSGLPCHDKNDYENPEVSVLTVTEGSGATETDCPPMSVSTSIQTVYNTVVMTVGPDGAAAPATTGTATTTEGVEQPMSSRNIRARQPRAPRSVRW